MKSIEESVVITSMDGTDKEIFLYLPYILQDTWEIGASPEIIAELIEKHAANPSILRILDLGCGKGAVSVTLSKRYRCQCLGIDAIPEFIDEAKRKAVELGVGELCSFTIGDIRKRINKLKDFDIIILGAIGPVFGNYYQTLSALSGCLKAGGLIIIDDGIIEDDSEFRHPRMEKRKDILDQIEKTGMRLIDERTIKFEDVKESDNLLTDGLYKRCNELIEKHPDKRDLFLNYMKKQEEETEILEIKVTCSTLVIMNETNRKE